jgi:opacity protein-like surface antigen
MSKVKALITGCIGALAFAACAHAADPPGSWRRPPPDPDYDRPQYKELASGWYLRGDLGYRWNSVGSVAASRTVTSQDWGNAVSGTLGFGYKYQWFRAELSADYGVPSRITGTTAVGAQPQYSAKVNSLSAMANLYADLGTWYGVTPYVGGGIGVSQLKSVNYVDTSVPTGIVAEPGKAINFSWALMTGVAYQVTSSWMIDVGYRYLSLGDVPGIDGAGTTNNAAVFKNLSAHEARVGFRFLLD